MQQGSLTSDAIDLQVLEHHLETLCRQEGVGAFFLDSLGRPLTAVIYPHVSAEMSGLLTEWLNRCLDGEPSKTRDRDVRFALYGGGRMLRILLPLFDRDTRLGFLGLIRLDPPETALLFDRDARASRSSDRICEQLFEQLDAAPFVPGEQTWVLIERFAKDLLDLFSPQITPTPELDDDQESAAVLTDCRWTIRRMNIKALQLLGFAEEEDVVGSDLRDFLLIDDARRKEFESNLNQSERTEPIDLLVERRDGTAFHGTFIAEKHRDPVSAELDFRFRFSPQPQNLPVMVKAALPQVEDVEPLERSASVAALSKNTSTDQAKSLEWFDFLPLPALILDDENRITHWNKATETVLKIPAVAVTGSTFDTLILVANQPIWQSWLSFFRQDSEREKFAAEEILPVLDNDGELVRIKCRLSRDSRLPHKAVLVTFAQWERENDFSRQFALIQDLCGAIHRRVTRLVTDRLGDLSANLNPGWTEKFSDCGVKKLAISDLFEGRYRAQILKHLRQALSERGQLVAFACPLAGRDCSLQLRASVSGEQVEWMLDAAVQRRAQTGAEAQDEKWSLESLFFLLGRLGEQFDGLLNEIQEQVDGAFTGHDRLPTSLARVLQKAGRFSRQLIDLTNRPNSEWQPVRLKSILHQAIAIQQQLFPVTVGFHLDLDKRICVVRGDAGRLYRAFSRLFEFLRQSLPDGGQITVRMRLQENDRTENVVLEISGAEQKWVQGGIAGLLDKLYEPGNSSNSLLALASAWSIFKCHEGDLQLSAPPADSEAFFTLTLPAVRPADDPAFEPVDESDRRTILLVDDDAEIIDINTLMLVNHGYRVRAARSAEEGAEFLSDHSGEIDLVILDVVLPDGDGMSLAERIAELYPLLPIVLCSGLVPGTTHNRFLENHRGAWLQKPFSCRSLVQTVSDLLELPHAGDTRA